MGVQRDERVLGLHPRPCRRHEHSSLRIVSRRRWALTVGPIPLLAMDARWRTCATRRHRMALPRFTIATAILVTLVMTLLVGQGWVPWLHPVAWGVPLAFWTLWALGSGVDRVLDARLSPLRQSLPPRQVHHPRRAAPRAVPKRGPVRRLNRALRAAVRLGRVIRARRSRPA